MFKRFQLDKLFLWHPLFLTRFYRAHRATRCTSWHVPAMHHDIFSYHYFQPDPVKFYHACLIKLFCITTSYHPAESGINPCSFYYAQHDRLGQYSMHGCSATVTHSTLDPSPNSIDLAVGILDRRSNWGHTFWLGLYIINYVLSLDYLHPFDSIFFKNPARL